MYNLVVVKKSLNYQPIIVPNALQAIVTFASVKGNHEEIHTGRGCVRAALVKHTAVAATRIRHRGITLL